MRTHSEKLRGCGICLAAMKVSPRCSGAALLAASIIGFAAPTAHAAEFGIKSWEAGTCNSDTPAEECLYTSPESKFYTQAAGHPPLGITAFEVNTTGHSRPRCQP